jgi:chromosome segregation ATPase
MNRRSRVAEAAWALRIVIGTAYMPDDPQTNFPEQGQADAFEPRTPDEHRAKDDILRVLSDFQQGLESLRVLHQQRSDLQARLLERETELARRGEELRERDGRLAAQKADCDAATALLNDQAEELARAREAHATRERELQAAAESLRSSLGTTQSAAEDASTDNSRLRDEMASCRSRAR